MKYLLPALVLAIAGCGGDDDRASAAPELTVLTFNVLCSFCNTREYDPWAERLAYFGDIFARHDADLIGIQELREVAAIAELLPGYESLYYAPATGSACPDATIFCRLTDWRMDANQEPDPACDLEDRIDHIFLASDDVTWTVSDWVVDLTVYDANDRYPSDHFPVVATVTYD